MNVLGCLLVWAVAQAGPPGWHYEEAGRFLETGPCHSAAQDGDRFALGCPSGVWTGPAAGLRLRLACRAASGATQHVRVLAPGVFVASTPCGLYRLAAGRPPVRIPTPGVPGALAVDGRGGWVVQVGEGLWAGSAALGLRRLGRWPAAEAAQSLAWSEQGVVGQGRDVWLSGARARRFRPPAPGARAALGGRDRIVWVGPRGQVWRQGLRGPATPWTRLWVEPAGRVRSLKDLGQGRVWAASGLRWFLLSEAGVQIGPLPGGGERILAVRGGPGEAPPWLVVDDSLLRPVPGGRLGQLNCPSPPPACRRLPQVPGAPSRAGWAWLLPRIELHACGGRRWTAGFLSSGGFRLMDDHGLGAAVLLSWPLGGELGATDLSALQVQGLARRESLARRARIASWLGQRQRLCANGTSTPRDLERLVEVQAILEVLCAADGEPAGLDAVRQSGQK